MCPSRPYSTGMQTALARDIRTAQVRPAQAADLDALLALESQAFRTDRISRRSFRRLLAAPSAAVMVAEHGGEIAGYALVLFRNGTPIARLYSIAVAPDAAGRRIGA